jgi:hypothetical protein
MTIRVDRSSHVTAVTEVFMPSVLKSEMPLLNLPGMCRLGTLPSSNMVTGYVVIVWMKEVC